MIRMTFIVSAYVIKTYSNDPHNIPDHQERNAVTIDQRNGISAVTQVKYS